MKQRPPNHQTTQPPNGPRHWRSLEELADTPAFRELVAKEFAGYDPDELLTMSRRRFLQLMGASLSLAGLTLAGCRRQPQERIAPFASRPTDRVPGQSRQFATLIERGGVATGLLVTAYDGRPIKIEGNPLHPFSLGASDAIAQASVLEMYDPDRARWVYQQEDETWNRRNWADFQAFADETLGPMRDGDAAALAVLAEPSDSPSHRAMREAFLSAYPGATWHEWEPINRDNEIAGAMLAFDQPVRAQYDLTNAKVIACFDCDLLCAHPGALRYARQWAAGRRSADQGAMNRVFAAEPGFTLTGSVADERLPIRAGRIGALVQALAALVRVPGVDEPESPEGATAFVESLASDLGRNPGKGIVVAGPGQPPEVHALVWAINQKLGNIGKTITMTEQPAAPDKTQLQQIRALTDRMRTGSTKHLLILGGNPVYDAPVDFEFASLIERLDTTIHLTLYANETTAACDWLLPRAHALESWGDGRAWDGTVSVQQPLILPLFDGRSPIELLSMLAEPDPRSGYDIVRDTFRQWLSAGTFETEWRKTLHDGVLADSAYQKKELTTRYREPAAPAGDVSGREFEVTFQPDRRLHDGRYANNGWLQELPEPMTKLVWENAALMSVVDAREMGIDSGDVVMLTIRSRSMELPVCLLPGQARGSIALWLGFGRTHSGKIGTGIGSDTYALRTSGHLHTAPGAAVVKTNRRVKLPLTTNHHLLTGVGEEGQRQRIGDKGHSGVIIREATLHEYEQQPNFAAHVGPHIPGVHGKDSMPLQLWPGPDVNGAKRPGGPRAFNEPHAWGMAIDMSACIGCGGCIVACQAENNVPIVGREQVLRHREMHWLRNDVYFKTDPELDPFAEFPEVAHMPMMCQQCENAPCEQVCPVAATMHDSEGLNTMVYNRCIGTRYCSNNCPYKVRRFNYFDFHAKNPRGTGIPGIQAKPWLGWPDTQQKYEVDDLKRMVFNPEVSVRMRGVMEKCTYCTQRIAAAKIYAKVDWNKTQQGVVGFDRQSPLVQDGEIVTACQQACPTEAIVFGDLNDADSRVSRLQANNRAYRLLEDLNTRPRTQYLAKIRNPIV